MQIWLMWTDLKKPLSRLLETTACTEAGTLRNCSQRTAERNEFVDSFFST
jgi:hypothetical protein